MNRKRWIILGVVITILVVIAILVVVVVIFGAIFHKNNDGKL